MVAVNRPGYDPVDVAQLGPAIARARDRIVHLEVPSLDVAASDLRRRVAEGRPITYLVPEAVRHYIHARGLYLS